ncbi:uncharacterized protein LOC134311799 [Trichomycterus rosablanca]|uniref:uncharacterized protein LOC134311799 n=1 Tax=Trichomycterus rosablanca TaxID=2290929 RepID=UPI002F35B3E5
MDVHITEPVKLIYSRDSAGVSAEDICWMENAGELQCRDDYKHRVSFHHTSITLRGVKPADSGVYTIQDMKNKDLHIYSVTVVFPVWAIILILLLVVLLVLYVLPLIVGVWILRKCVDLRKKILQLLWFPVKQVKDDVVRNTVLLAAAPLYSALVLWMEYKNLKKKYLQYKNHSEGFDVYFKLQENNEDGISDIKSDEQKQQVLFYLLVDLNDYVDQFRSAEESGESYTEAWKNIEHVNGLLQVLNNTSLSQENHTV